MGTLAEEATAASQVLSGQLLSALVARLDVWSHESALGPFYRRCIGQAALGTLGRALGALRPAHGCFQEQDIPPPFRPGFFFLDFGSGGVSRLSRERDPARPQAHLEPLVDPCAILGGSGTMSHIESFSQTLSCFFGPVSLEATARSILDLVAWQ